MLTYQLENRGNKPLYEYLYLCIRKDIQAHVLKTHEKMPSKRSLAEHLGISVVTVQNAYEQLLLEGYLYSIEKRGYFVSQLEGETRSSCFPQSKSEPVTSGFQQPKIEAEPNCLLKKTLVDFTSNHALMSQFPAAAWARLMRQTLTDNETDYFRSPEHTGVDALRKAVAEHLRSYSNLTVDPQAIVIGAGTEYLYHLLVQLLGHNRMIAVEDPGHTKIGRIYENNGVRVLHIPVDSQGLCVDKLLGNNVSCVHISPSHQFPTGVVMPASRRHELISWAREQNSYIIEDDYDSEFRFQGRPISAMTSIAPDRVIYMNTFSKTLMPSIRIAYMILPPSLLEPFQRRLGFYSCTVSSFEQYTLARFISEGYYGRHINRMRNYYRKRRDRLIALLKDSPLYPSISIEETGAGLHFLLNIHAPIDDQSYEMQLEKYGILIRSIAAYCHNHQEHFAHKFLINYSDTQEENLSEAFFLMSKLLYTK